MTSQGQRISRTKGTRLAAAVAAASAFLVTILAAAPGASADLQFCPSGAGAGECAPPANISSLRGVAADEETGRLYVADEANDRVLVFEEDGEFAYAFGWGVADGTSSALQSCSAECFAGIAGGGAGQFDNPVALAVDSAAGSPSLHALYVVDMSNFRLQKFLPGPTAASFVWMRGIGVNDSVPGNLCTAASGNTCGAGENSETEGGVSSKVASRAFVGVGPGGTVHLLDNLRPAATFKQRLQRFDPGGAIAAPQCVLFEGGRATAIAVESGGGMWVAGEEGGAALRRYDSGCVQQVEAAAGMGVRNNGLAVDATGVLLAAQGEPRDPTAPTSSFEAITARDATGQILRRFGYGRLGGRIAGLAVLDDAGETRQGGLFAGLREAGVVRLDSPEPPLPPPGPIAAPPSLEAPAAQIGSTKATLVAEVNPEGKPTDVRFQFVSEAEYEKDKEEGGDGFEGPTVEETPTVALGTSDFRLKRTEAQIGCPNPGTEALEPDNDCLTPEAAYRFRVIATNADGAGEGSAEGSFTTTELLILGDLYATGVGTDTARLHAEANPQSVPASGYFEYVTEAEFEQSGFVGAAKAPDVDAGQVPLDFGAGEALVTRSAILHPLAAGTSYRYRLVVENPLAEIRSEPVEVRTFSQPEVEQCPNRAFRGGAAALLPDCRAYEMVSPVDKAGGDVRVLTTNLQNPAVLEQSAESGERLAYGSARAFAAAPAAPYTSQYVAERVADLDGEWSEREGWLTHAITPPRGRPVFAALSQADTELRALSPDLCRAWLVTLAESPWAAPPAQPQYSNVFRRGDHLCGAEGYEALAPVVIPEGQPPADFALELQGVSGDGDHAIFLANAKLAAQGSEGVLQLYESPAPGAAPRLVCIRPAAEGGGAVAGSCTAGSRSGGEHRRSSVLGAISDDGERIYFSDAGTGLGRLYVRIGGSQTVAVSKAAEEATASSMSSSFRGASADGSRAIFTSAGTLFSFELQGEASTQIAAGSLGVMGISEDASRVYFVSSKALPGSGANEEGAEAVEGQPNLYLHEAGQGGGQTRFIATLAGADVAGAVSNEPASRTSRVSADGAHAAFASTAPLTGYDNQAASGGSPTREIYLYDAGEDELLCASCNPTLARPAGPSGIPPFASNLYASRALSADGRRLYFNSSDRLVARDSNGQADVYQWEEAGAGGCDALDAGFSPEAGGCIELISSGQAPQPSRFLDADPGGENVFFVTVASLLPQDPGLFDVYDARAGGGLPIPAPLPPSCEGEACQSPPPPPGSPTPASSVFEGAGNRPEPAGASGCEATARKAKSHARRAAALRRRAGRATKREAGALRRRASRLDRRAERLSRSAKRCRARARKQIGNETSEDRRAQR